MLQRRCRHRSCEGLQHQQALTLPRNDRHHHAETCAKHADQRADALHCRHGNANPQQQPDALLPPASFRLGFLGVASVQTLDKARVSLTIAWRRARLSAPSTCCRDAGLWQCGNSHHLGQGFAHSHQRRERAVMAVRCWQHALTASFAALLARRVTSFAPLQGLCPGSPASAAPRCSR